MSDERRDADEVLRELLDEGPPPPELEERTIQALRAEIRSLEADRQPRPRWWLVVSTAVAAVALIAVGWATLLASPTARAGWSPVPTRPPDPALVQAAPRICTDTLDRELPPLLLVDQREGTAAVLFAEEGPGGERQAVTCLLTQRQGTWSGADGDGIAPRPHHTMAGWVDEELLGGDVARGVVDSGGGAQPVEVSYEDGFFLVWWPQSVPLAGKELELRSETGETLLSIPVRDTGRTP